MIDIAHAKQPTCHLEDIRKTQMLKLHRRMDEAFAHRKERLQQAKSSANEIWRKNSGSSERLSQLMGTLPSMSEGSSTAVPQQRFKVHSSHATVALRSIVHCKLCGYWASKKSQKLQDVCQRMPPHSDGAHKLRRMLGGLHPEVKVKIWPDGHDARIPSQPIPVDWS